MRRPILIAALALLAGCLDFDEQEIRVVYDAGRDRIDAQLVYRGLFSASKMPRRWFRYSSEPEDREGTDEQLDQLLAGRPIFALFDAETPFDLVRLRESAEAPVAALSKLTTVDRGGFFESADGRLCAWQHLRIRNVARVLEIYNRELRAVLADPKESSALRASLGCDDPASVKLWSDATSNSRPWLERSGTELLFHLPASETASRALAIRIETAPTFDSLYEAASRRKDDEEEGDYDAAKPSEPERPAHLDDSVVRRDSELRGSRKDWFAATLHTYGVTVRAREDGADLVLWDSSHDTRVVRVTRRRPKEKHYDLAPYLEKRKVSPRTDVTDATLAQAFAEFRAER
jgi:hypothetical protein